MTTCTPLATPQTFRPGDVDYTDKLTISNADGLDISTATITLSLGTWDDPGTWKAVDLETDSGSLSTRIVQLKIGDAYQPPAGTYWLWWELTNGTVTKQGRAFVIFILSS